MTPAELLAAMELRIEQLLAEVGRLTKERDDMRAAIIHACTLQGSRSRDSLELRAIRQTANYLATPFSLERVDELAKQLGSEHETLEADRDSARAALVSAEQTTAEAIATWLDAKAAYYVQNRNIGPYSAELASDIREGKWRL